MTPNSSHASIAAQPDPIFAAIEKHQTAAAVFLAAAERATKADDDEANAACDAEVEAMANLLKTGPATLAGARALVQHLAGLTDGCLPQGVSDLVTCLARSPLFAA